MFREFIIRVIGMTLFGLVGCGLGALVGGERPSLERGWWILSLALSGGLGGLFAIHLFRWVGRQIRSIPASALLAGVGGLLIGLFVAALLALPLSMLPGLWGKVVPALFSLLSGYLGASILVMRERELAQVVGFSLSSMGMAVRRTAPPSEQILLDTSAVIDGRIADISHTGFIQGTLLIPRFVLNELQHIADSPDALRRKRGRRGLEMLNKLQKEAEVPVQVSDVDFEDTIEVDAKLVRLAKSLRCPIVTNDFNLNRVAELQGVKVLNVNELANAVKSVVLPGEEMAVRIIQEGKEAGQGVGFLDDGTMVVVEGGRRYLNTQLAIIVTRVLQTVAGRMIFAQPKNGVR